jgi:hypothetical protein
MTVPGGQVMYEIIAKSGNWALHLGGNNPEADGNVQVVDYNHKLDGVEISRRTAILTALANVFGAFAERDHCRYYSFWSHVANKALGGSAQDVRHAEVAPQMADNCSSKRAIVVK